MVVKIGMVEKDEPIPIVTRSPITSIRNAASGLLFQLYVHSFALEIQHVLFSKNSAESSGSNHNKANKGHHTHSAC